MTAKSLLLAAVMAMSPAFVIAQEESQSEAAPGGAVSDLPLSNGDPVLGTNAAGVTAGQPYVLEEFSDWSIRCISVPDGREPCTIYQLLTDEDGNEVAEVNFFPLDGEDGAAAGANVVVPLETLLPAQLTLSVDGANARRYPYAFCNQVGCVARLGFTQAEVDEMKAGAMGLITLVPAAAPDQRVDLEMSLSGFTAAMEFTGTREEDAAAE